RREAAQDESRESLPHRSGGDRRNRRPGRGGDAPIMTKPGPEDMEVVEMDAIDLGDWEKNMATSEVPMAGLQALVKQTAKAPAQRAPRQTATHVVSTAPQASVARATPRPVRVSSTEATRSDHPPTPARIEAPAPRASSRFTPRMLVLGGGAIAVIVVVIVIVARGGSSSETKPEVANADPSTTAAQPVAAM